MCPNRVDDARPATFSFPNAKNFKIGAFMSRRRKKNYIPPWLSARLDDFEKRFIQVGDTLLFNRTFQSLKANTKHLYFCMAMESAGHREFKFTLHTAKKYGFSPSTFRRCVKELVDNRFIEYQSGANTRTANRYRFTFEWKLR